MTLWSNRTGMTRFNTGWRDADFSCDANYECVQLPLDQYGCGGHVINLPQDVASFVQASSLQVLGPQHWNALACFTSWSSLCSSTPWGCTPFCGRVAWHGWYILFQSCLSLCWLSEGSASVPDEAHLGFWLFFSLTVLLTFSGQNWQT